jgi:hypothetical protein
VAAETVHASKVLASFLSLLFARPAAEVVDLGPVTGSNVTFLGERVGCKIHVEDLCADIDHHIKQDKFDQLPKFLSGRLSMTDASIDAVLSWNIFDYLAPLAASALAQEIVRILRPGRRAACVLRRQCLGRSALHQVLHRRRAHLRHRFYPSACGGDGSCRTATSTSCSRVSKSGIRFS